MIPPLRWNDDARRVELLDQTRLPMDEVWVDIDTVEQMAEAIRSLRVRGAPAIGIAAAYGVVLALRDATTHPQQMALAACDQLSATRPTAVNLFYALRRMRSVVDEHPAADRETLYQRLLAEAQAIEREDRDAGQRLGEHGLSLLREGMTVMTHCHAGGVATSGYGTALAPLILGNECGLRLRAIVDETRPLLQGSRITAWELHRAGIPTTLITDSMAGHVMQQGQVDAIIVGADRIAANGDVANKIGTYALAVLASVHEIPFYVAAPLSTVDFETPCGDDVEIEERDADEVRHGFGKQTAPDKVEVYNPAFDVTPAALITAIITEHGIIEPPFGPALQALRQTGAERTTSTTG